MAMLVTNVVGVRRTVRMHLLRRTLMTQMLPLHPERQLGSPKVRMKQMEKPQMASVSLFIGSLRP